MTKPIKVIFDTDPGIDDAMAYFYGHASDAIDIIGMTTIFGNVSVSNGTRNALWLSEVSGKNIPVFQGASEPLEMPARPHSSQVHGSKGFGAFEIAEVAQAVQSESASDYLVRIARENPAEIVLCAVGPLTNVALAIQKDPEFIGNLKRLVIMGGSLDEGGNISPFAEANFYNDPHAADIVLKAPESGGPEDGEIVIIGLDVTNSITFSQENFDRIRALAPETGRFLSEIGQFYMDFYQSVSGKRYCSLHDPAAMVACVKPELFEMQLHRLSVVKGGERIGEMVRDGSTLRSCLVAMKADAQAVADHFEAVVSRNP